MKKYVKKVLIIGNGFDLDLGRKTLYKDFYNSEDCPREYPAPLINYLNSKWASNLDAVKWYDLENELYSYYDQIKKGKSFDLYNNREKLILDKIRNSGGRISENDAPIVLNIDAVRNLYWRKILRLENGYVSLSHEDILNPSIVRDRKALKLIKEGLIRYLTKEQEKPINEQSIAATIIKAFIDDKANDQRLIYSFNYTDMDAIFSHSNLPSRFIDAIKYVHGCCLKKNIILGTKDEKINNDYDFLQKSFDSLYNPPAMVYDLMDSDDITIFGHSLGANDSQYFKAFFEKQSSSINPQKKNITIFTKDEKSEIEIKRSLQEMTNWNLTSLYGLNDLEIIKTDKCNENPNEMERYMTRLASQMYHLS